MRTKDEQLAEDYRESVGHDPQNLPPDHPYHWQWEYRGTRQEREALAEQLGLVPEETPVIDGQEELF